MYPYLQWQQDNIDTNEAKTTRRECKVYHFPHCKHLNIVKPGPERILAPIIGGEIQDFQNILKPRTPEHCSLLDGRSKEHTSSIQHSTYKHKLYLTSRARLLCVMIKCEASKQSSCPHDIPGGGARSRSQTIRHTSDICPAHGDMDHMKRLGCILRTDQ